MSRLSATTLKLLTEQSPVLEGWKRQVTSEEDVDEILQEIKADLRTSRLLEVDIARSIFPYTSFVEIFCRLPSTPSERVAFAGYEPPNGVLVYVSRLVPIYVYGPGRRDPVNGFKSSLSHGDVGNLPEGNWSQVTFEVERIMKTHGFRFLTREEGDVLLPFEAPYFETLLGEKPFRVFDAVFHAYD